MKLRRREIIEIAAMFVALSCVEALAFHLIHMLEVYLQSSVQDFERGQLIGVLIASAVFVLPPVLTVLVDWRTRAWTARREAAKRYEP